jgi:Protein of unknown function (DUF3592)
VIVFAVILVLCGIGLLFGARYTMRKGETISAWPRAQGRITAKQAVFQTDLNTAGTAKRDRYAPEVRYVFSVDGVEYEGATITPETRSLSSRARAERKVAKIPDDPQVYYDPADPKTSCLTPPGKSDVAFIGLAGLAFLAVGIFLALK